MEKTLAEHTAIGGGNVENPYFDNCVGQLLRRLEGFDEVTFPAQIVAESVFAELMPFEAIFYAQVVGRDEALTRGGFGFVVIIGAMVIDHGTSIRTRGKYTRKTTPDEILVTRMMMWYGDEW